LNLRKKIKDRLDELQSMMERQEHLSHPEHVKEQLESVTKFWSVQSEEDREFITSVRLALLDKLIWRSCV
jgi:uncharacterized protein YydD (DUF2326 family)